MRGKVLLVKKDTIFYSKGVSIFKRNLDTKSDSLFIRLPFNFVLSIFSRIDIIARVLRSHVHHMIEDELGNFYIIYSKKIIKLDRNGGQIGSLTNLKGNRPLCVALIDNSIIYGQYTSNPYKKPVGIYAYNGDQHTKLHQINGPRHIHGIFIDPFDGLIYVTTGDADKESGIWRLDLDTGFLEPILVGSQHSRAVQLVFTRDCIYFGSDTPFEKNYIYKLNKKSHSVKTITQVSSSVFYGATVGGVIFFSTAAEYSNVNSTDKVDLIKIEHDKAEIIKTFKKDFLSKKYFQYGQIIFPSFAKKEEIFSLWFFKLGVKGSGVSEEVNFLL